MCECTGQSLSAHTHVRFCGRAKEIRVRAGYIFTYIHILRRTVLWMLTGILTRKKNLNLTNNCQEALKKKKKKAFWGRGACCNAVAQGPLVILRRPCWGVKNKTEWTWNEINSAEINYTQAVLKWTEWN